MKVRFLSITLLFNFWATGNEGHNPCPQIESLPKASQSYESPLLNEPLTILSQSKAQELFEYLAKKEDIPYKYVIDGCDVRAYLGAKDLNEKLGIHSFRANLESYPSMVVNTPYSFEGFVEFSKHSAIALCVFHKDEKVVKPMIIDPAFFNEVKEVNDWRNSLKDEFFADAPTPDLYYSSQYSLNPESQAKDSFSKEDLKCANKVRSLFMKEQRKIERGKLPYGVGRAKEVLRQGLCD